MPYNEQIKFRPIRGNNGTKTYDFPAFLETFGVTYEIQENSIGFSPLSFPTDKIRTRMIQNLDMSVNVFSKDAGEASTNYDNLNKLLYVLKPRYLNIGSQYIPSSENLFGHLYIEFKGFPQIEGKQTDSIRISCTQFKYEINKDLGFVASGSAALIPVGFKITLGGRIITTFMDGLIRETDEVASGEQGTSNEGTENIQDIIDSVGGTLEGFNQALTDAFPALSGGRNLTDWVSVNSRFALALAELIKVSVSNRDITYITATGKFGRIFAVPYSEETQKAITAAQKLKPQ